MNIINTQDRFLKLVKKIRSNEPLGIDISNDGRLVTEHFLIKSSHEELKDTIVSIAIFDGIESEVQIGNKVSMTRNERR